MMVEMIALKEFSHSVGVIEVNQRFKVNPTYARELIANGIAKTVDAAMIPQRAPRRWPGAHIVIMASGPSLTDEMIKTVGLWASAETDENRKVIVINTTYQSAPWADILYAADLAWWKEYGDDARQVFTGEMWSQHAGACQMFKLRHIQCERRPGLSALDGVIHNGGNSGYQAIGLAADFGATRITLLGYDMKNTNGKKHHHSDHPKSLRQSSPFATWIPQFKQLAHDAKARGIRIVNATPDSALKCFDYVDLEEALR